MVLINSLKADVEANKKTGLKVRVSPDRRLFSDKFLKYSRTTLASQIKVYFGCERL